MDNSNFDEVTVHREITQTPTARQHNLVQGSSRDNNIFYLICHCGVTRKLKQQCQVNLVVTGENSVHASTIELQHVGLVGTDS